MVSDAYKGAMEKAKAQLIHAIRQRDFWNLEITRLQQLYKSLMDAQGQDLSAMEDVLVTGQVGFADLVQSIVSRSPGSVSATEVRDAVWAAGYDLREYSNALSLIHQTLKRLAEKGRIKNLGDGRYASSPFYGALLATKPK